MCVFVCVCLYVYPSSANSFEPIGIKLGIDIPWDLGSDMGQIRLRFAISAKHIFGNKRLKKHVLHFSAFQSISSQIIYENFCECSAHH